jgi:DNA-binding transcriptional LysR family regulator
MRIEQLECVASLARAGSSRRAAEALRISQQALDESVGELELELGVELVERQHSGAAISAEGRELLPHVQDALEAVERLRRAAGDRHRNNRAIRLGTVAASSVPLMTPTIHAFRACHASTPVEIVAAQQVQILQALREGTMDLGLVNHLVGDEMPPELESTELLRGRPVVCLRPDDPLAAKTRISPEDLLAQSLVATRSGCPMHRYLLRLLGDAAPVFSYAADGAEMAKLMVAAGLGVAVLPDYSLIGDPLAERGDIAYRAVAAEQTEVMLVLHRRRAGPAPEPARDLHELLVRRARAFAHEGLETGEREAAKRAA